MGDRAANNDKRGKKLPIRRTQPLDPKEILEENINSGGDSKIITSATIEMGRKSQREKDKKKRGPIKEKWLLTRKTWRYMADAGRKLIPDGALNRPEDIPKIEEHFQKVCRSEPKFILWRRKCSYPGAMTASRYAKWRGKGTIPKGIRLRSTDEGDEHTENADQIMNMLKSYLNLSDDSKKTVTLLGANTVRPDQAISPSSKRPTSTSMASTSQSGQQSWDIGKSDDITNQITELLDRLKLYTEASPGRSLLSSDMITKNILEDKALLKKVYNELKKQQLHRVLGKHSGRSTQLPHSSSLSSLWHFRRDLSKESKKKTPTSSFETLIATGTINKDQKLSKITPEIQPPVIPIVSIKKPIIEKKTFSSAHIQTDFIHLTELQRLSKDYDAIKREEERLNRLTDDDSDKSGPSHSKRKSSIDNEDVSQSVSDTIKRYLRMARKKSVHDDAANRFKRVNYDRNLRNIRAKGEINPPGMDEGNSKATQTLDAWPTLAYAEIRGANISKLLEEAHADWSKSLEKRLQNKQQYDEKIRQQEQKDQQKEHEQQSKCSSNASTTSGHSSPQTSPPSTSTGLFHSSTQFLSNLWHGHHHSTHDTSVNNSPDRGSNSKSRQSSPQQQRGSTSNMQKSKSSSNVGQFVSKKIWKSRSKSQTRTSSPTKPEWTPQGNCVWTSASGKRLVLSDAKLHDLTEIERRVLHRVAIDKINQLNIGVNVTAPGDASGAPAKPQKRRPLLIKRKALTTGFFDSGKKSGSKDVGSGLVFGVSLEKCVDNEQRLLKDQQGSDRGSRNSITTLLTGSNKSGTNQSDDGSGLINPSTIQMSRSQSDIRRSSQDEDDLAAASAPPMAYLSRNIGQQVPSMVESCIKHLEDYGLHTVGIFRVGASKKRVRQLREEFDRGEITSIDPDTCPHDVAAILKEYLRDLPEPLLCRNLYKAFVKTQKIRNRRLQLEALSHLVQLLPVAHRDTLYALLKFLAKIVRTSDDVTSRDGTVLSVGNKMDSSNLATVFAPNILRCTSAGQSTTEQEIDDQIDVINVIRTMIDHYEELFRVPADLLDEVYTNMIDSYPQQLDYLCEKRDVTEKYDDDMDSGTSSTPLSSPPPTSASATIDLARQLFGEPIDTTPRRVYSREDFMHENAAKGDPNGNAAIVRRRERTSKMKYIESENEMARRRRRERDRSIGERQGGQTQSNQQQQQIASVLTYSNNSGCIASDDTHSISSLGGTNQQLQLQQQQQQQKYQHQQQQQQVRSSSVDPSSRRLSTPHFAHGTGIVTASLKIPVQMQSSAQQQQQVYSGGGGGGGGGGGMGDDSYRSSGHLDLSDIPFIEDSISGQDFEGQFRQMPITGSLSFGNRKESIASSMYQIPISYDGRVINSPSGSSSTSPETIRQAPFTQLASNNTGILAISTKRGDSIKRTSRKHSNSNLTIAKVKSSGELAAMDNRKEYTGASTTYTASSSTASGLSSHGYNEPKISASISSIGGAVLRSKTADFERMLRNKKYKTGDTDELTRSLSTAAVETSQSSSSTASTILLNTAAGSNGDKTRRQSQGQGHVYKRQELISSAKRSPK